MTLRHIIAVTLTALASASMALTAQQTIGSWQLFNNYTSDISNMVDTPHRVYIVSDGNLYSYDKDTEEFYGYTRINTLSDNTITDIRRNYSGNFITIAYRTGNLDLLYDDGRVVNLPEIHDAQAVGDKTIYDVAFDGDLMYVATGFGLVAYDVKSGSVKGSGIYNRPVHGVTVMGDNVMLIVDGTAYTFTSGNRFATLGHLTDLGPVDMRQIEPLSDTLLLASQRGAGDRYGLYRFDPQGPALTEILTANLPAMHNFTHIDDKVVVSNPYGFYLYRANPGSSIGYDAPYYSVPNNLQYKNRLAYSGGYTPGNVFWYASIDGIGTMTHDGNYRNFSVTGESTTIPFGTNIDTGVAGFSIGSRGIYAYNRGASRFPVYNYSEEKPAVNLIDNGFISDVSPAQTIIRVPEHAPGGPPQRVLEDPNDPSVLYIGSFFEGIHVNRDDNDLLKYDWRNTPADSTWCHMPLDFAFDTQGNLWVCTMTLTREYLMVLPADKRLKTDVKTSDWTPISIGTLAGNNKSRDFKILPLRAAKNRNIIMFADGFDPNNLAVLNTGGNVSSTASHTSRATDKFVDQDGLTFGPLTIASIAEDLNGSVWVGTDNGVFAIHNPAAFISPNATVERIKVPRNDGTSLADYLLQSQTVTTIAVDGANRKWLGTLASGIYLVSADGKEILDYFNINNSPLPSNCIKAITCEPDGNRVYVATDAGMACYSSTASPAEESFDNVYAYPNPVRPDYNGWITITGLMENSLVKIVDVSGNVLLQTQSSGGMVTWNGCDTTGRRVSSGVYYVLGSQGEESSTGKVVTKILVVN